MVEVDLTGGWWVLVALFASGYLAAWALQAALSHARAGKKGPAVFWSAVFLIHVGSVPVLASRIERSIEEEMRAALPFACLPSTRGEEPPVPVVGM